MKAEAERSLISKEQNKNVRHSVRIVKYSVWLLHRVLGRGEKQKD